MSIKELIRGTDVFVQVGTNTGRDFFNEIVRFFKPELVILIEPNKGLNESIKENYKGINVSIENVAITEYFGDVTLYHPNKEGYYHGCFSLLPMDDWGEKTEMESLTVSGVPFSFIKEKYMIDKIDFLCIDTEGYDAIILDTLDLSKISLIVFEYWHFAPEVFKKHNKNWNLLGSVAHERICGKLKDNGFSVFEDPDCWYNRIAVNENIGSHPIL